MRRCALAVVVVLGVVWVAFLGLLMASPSARTDALMLWRDSELVWRAVQPSSLKVGDHIYAKRFLGLYTHHGIVVAVNPVAVVHFSGASLTVQRGTLDAFLGWQSLRVRRARYGLSPYLLPFLLGETSFSEPSRPASEVVACAEGVVGDANYDLFDHNCEGMAYFCKTGISWHSYQARMLLGTADLLQPLSLLFKVKHWTSKVLATAAELCYVLVRRVLRSDEL